MPAEDKGTRAAPAGVLLRLRAGDWQCLPGHERCILFPCSAPWQSSLGAGESLLSREHRWRKGSHAWERTQRCLCAGTCLPACLSAACRLPAGCSPLCPRSKEGVWAPPWPCDFTPVRDACRCCLGFASHVGRARKRHYLCLQTCRTFILRPSQLGEICRASAGFCHDASQVVVFSGTEEWAGACESVKSAERKSFLTYLLNGGDAAHGKPLSLSSPPSSIMCLAPAACPPRCPQAPAEVPQPQVYC